MDGTIVHIEPTSGLPVLDESISPAARDPDSVLVKIRARTPPERGDVNPFEVFTEVTGIFATHLVESLQLV